MSTNEPGGPPTEPWQPPPPYGQQPYGQQPYGQQPYGQQPPAYGYQPYAAPTTEGTAVGALVASILAWVVCPLIPAIVALVMIPGSKRKIESSGGRLTGEGMLTAAKWIAWINIGLWALGIVAFIVLVVISAATSSTGTTSDFSFGTLLAA